jgi:hypothetical protein
MTQSTIQIPDRLYQAIRQQAKAQNKTPDVLATEWLSERFNEPEVEDVMVDFEKEAAAFEKLKPLLLQHYPDKYVAIYGGEVVASGDNQFTLLKQVHQTYGPVACYIDKVEAEERRPVRVPSVWIVRQ